VSLRSEAISAYEASQNQRTTEARQALIGIIGDPGGTVTAMTVEDVAVTDSYTLVVFTDGDVHLGVRTRESGWDVHLVEPADSGLDGWTRLEPAITSLPQLGKVLPDLDPVDENAAPKPWATGLNVKVGERYTYNGGTYEVLVAHTTTTADAPDKNKSYWAKVA
jgi:hypothetical protein